MATMNISLPEPMKEWAEAQAESGKYGNVSDYVRDLIRHDQERAEARETLQTIIDEALASGITTLGREELMERSIARARIALQAKKSA